MEDIPRSDPIPPKKRTVKPSLPGHAHGHDSNNNTPTNSGHSHSLAGTPTNGSDGDHHVLSPLLEEQRLTIGMERTRRASTIDQL